MLTVTFVPRERLEGVPAEGGPKEITIANISKPADQLAERRKNTQPLPLRSILAKDCAGNCNAQL